MVTQFHVAQEVGLDRTTVGAILNNKPTLRVRPQTRQLVLDAARRMGYVPHSAGRRLNRRRRTAVTGKRAVSFDQVGMISFLAADDHTDPVRQAMTDGAEHALSHLGASLTLVRVSQESDWEKVHRLTWAGGIDGWLLYGPVDDAIVERLSDSKIPFVVVGEHRCSRAVHSVNIDNVAVGQLAVEHLAALGHRRIGFYAGDMNLAYQREARGSFRAARDRLGLDRDDALLHWDSDGRSLFPWLTQSGMTALFVLELDISANLCRMLNQLGDRVPRELSILACESASSAARMHNLFRVELPLSEVGGRAVTLLHQLANDPGLEARELKVNPTIVVGWSVAPPSSKANHIRSTDPGGI